jgi:hypothetical protein
MKSRLTFLQTRCFIVLIRHLFLLKESDLEYENTKKIVNDAITKYNAPSDINICLAMLIDLLNEYHDEMANSDPCKNICGEVVIDFGVLGSGYSYFS